MPPKAAPAAAKNATAQGATAGGMKRFTNGHKTFTTAQADAQKEIMDKTAFQQEVAAATLSYRRKPRNPVLGELTSREDAEVTH
jgi:hypothetical protein